MMKRLLKNGLRFLLLGLYYPALYRLHACRAVCSGKVVFIENTSQGYSDNFRLILERIRQDAHLTPVLCMLRQTESSGFAYHRRCCRMIRQIADAQYIFLNDGLSILSRIPFRRETHIVNVWHACGAFKKFGFGSADLKFGESRRVQERYPNYAYCDEMYVSAQEVVDKYAYSTGLPPKKIMPIGVSRTDVFFDAAFLKQAGSKLADLFPSSQGKKIILYAPTFRGTVRGAKAPQALDIGAFYEALSADYVLVIKQHPYVKERPETDEAYADFAADLTQEMSIEELLCAADICITDYSSVIFEYALLTRPMIFFAFDKEEYDDWRGFYYDYEEMTPGPVFTENHEMIEYIRRIDACFDSEEVRAFREKFMSACDGHATDRVMERFHAALPGTEEDQ